MKTTFMEPLCTKWATEPLFLLVTDFVIGETVSTRVIVDISIWVAANLRTLLRSIVLRSIECMQAYHLLII